MVHEPVQDMTADDDRRKQRRWPMLAAYTTLRVRRAGRQRFSMAGHVYDLSSSGMRFELDQPLAAGEQIEIEVNLPGISTHSIRAAGRVVRFCDEEETGPCRMAVVFDNVRQPSDSKDMDRLMREASDGSRRLSAAA